MTTIWMPPCKIRYAGTWIARFGTRFIIAIAAGKAGDVCTRLSAMDGSVMQVTTPSCSGAFWIRKRRIEAGIVAALSVTYVQPHMRELPLGFTQSETDGHVSLSATPTAAVRVPLGPRLWLIGALGIEVPITYRDFVYTDTNGEKQVLVESWPVRPVVSLALAVGLL